MRGFWVGGGTIALILALAAIAYAQVMRTNTYSVESFVSPSTQGSPTEPVSVGITFNLKVGEEADNRPVPVERYSFRFAGLRQNSNRFRGCSAARINANQGTGECPKYSLIGKGKLHLVAGAEADSTSRRFDCPLNVEIHNARLNKAAVYIVGGPDAPAGKTTTCALSVNAAIPANFVRRGGSLALELHIPPEPFRFYQGYELSVVSFRASLLRKTTRYRGRRVGYFETAGDGCVAGRRAITAVLHDEDGGLARVEDTATCR